MVGKKPVHLMPNDGVWAVWRDGASRVSSIRRPQAEAEKIGRDRARADLTEFLLHGRNGETRDRDSYGHDPYPPAG